MHSAEHTRQLRAVGLRATQGRMALLHALEGARRPLSAQEIGKRLDLNIVSVYRALEQLVEKGLVRQGSDGRVSHFSYGPAPHHHHMVCSDCGFSARCAAC